MSEDLSQSRFTALLGVTAVLFFFALLPFELIPEIPVDIDAKPFFVPLALCALLAHARTGLAIGLGVALGEGLRDVMEGYELDDPIGFFGYVAGFWTASAVFSVAPTNRLVLIAGSVLCAAIQATMEASSFLLFGSEAFGVAVQSAIGNTISHGIIFGAAPMLFLTHALRGRIERPLGFAPGGAPPGPPLKSAGGAPIAAKAVAGISGGALRYPGAVEPALEGASLDVMEGEIIGLLGAPDAGKKSLALALAGAAPRATGGEFVGEVRTASSAAWIGAHPREFMTQARAVEQVAASAEGATPVGDARAALAQVGLPEWRHDEFVWALDEAELVRVQIAAALVRQPRLLVVDAGVDAALGADGRRALDDLLKAQKKRGAAIVIAERPSSLRDRVDRVGLVERGRVTGVYPDVDAAPFEPVDADSAPSAAPAGGTDEAAPVRVPTLQTGRGGWWSNRDPRVKWLLFLTLIVLIYVAPDWRWMAAMAMLGVGIALTARPNLIWLSLAFFVQIPNIIGLLLIPLLGDGAATGEEFAFGLRLALGWIAAILFGISLLSTMETPELVAGLRGIGLPQRFAHTVGYAFVLIYLSLADLSSVVRDMKKAGATFDLRRPRRFFASFVEMFAPVIETVAERGGAMSVALELNGAGGPSGVARSPRMAPLSAFDLLLLAAAGAIFLAAAAARFG